MQKEWTGERLETFVFNDVTIEHLHRYALAKEFIKNKIVLDIACGEGYGSNILAQDANSVIGVDIDQETITHAIKKYQKKNLSFLQGSVENIPCAPHSFDVIISFETLEHTAEHTKMLEEIKRVLKPGGILIISTPEKKAYTELLGSYSNPFHKKELYKKEFSELLGRFFKYQISLNQNLFITSLIICPEYSRTQIYQGNFQEIKHVQNIDPLYIIALCSDNQIPAPPSTIFASKNILETILKDKEQAVQNSFTYKVGHVLLLPAKIFIRLFVKRKR